MKHKRYTSLDILRGFTLLSMILYHTLWDLVYLFDLNLPWYQSRAAYFWQQSICYTFILLSGFCFSLSKHRLKRGLIVFLAGALVSAVTLIAMPENRVLFGVLTLIGSCMLLMIPLDSLLQKCTPWIGLTLSLVLFILTRHVSQGFLGPEFFRLCELPEGWYSNLFTAYLGFPIKNFFSTDYFALIPWIFLFLSGYFLYKLMEQHSLLLHLEFSFRLKPMEWLGRHSLVIYILHQPLIYLLLSFVF